MQLDSRSSAERYPPSHENSLFPVVCQSCCCVLLNSSVCQGEHLDEGPLWREEKNYAAPVCIALVSAVKEDLLAQGDRPHLERRCVCLGRGK